jgi:hypothetical protein
MKKLSARAALIDLALVITAEQLARCTKAAVLSRPCVYTVTKDTNRRIAVPRVEVTKSSKYLRKPRSRENVQPLPDIPIHRDGGDAHVTHPHNERVNSFAMNTVYNEHRTGGGLA